MNHKDYKCEVCGAEGVKLWRDYGSFKPRQRCAPCLGFEADAKGKRKGLFGETDQFFDWVPAVPTKEGNAYWGYTSVPDEGVAWWRSLPSKKEKRNDK